MPSDVSDVPAAVAGGSADARGAEPAGRGPALARSGYQARASLRALGNWAAVAVPGIAVLAADGYGLGHLSLWRDEAFTVDASHRSLAEIFALLAHTDAVNGVYYLAMHADIMLLGTSEVALRLPSLLAMAVAAVMTAVIGRRLARATRLPAPAVTGLLAGLLFVAAPQITKYAQDARSYAIVTMFATIATYLLLRAVNDGRWRWWVSYGCAMALMAGFNLLAFLLVTAHAVTVLTARARRARPGPDAGAAAADGEKEQANTGAAPPVAHAGPAGTPPVRVMRWLAAVAGAVIALIPLLTLGIRQRGQLSWLGRSRLRDVMLLMDFLSGSRALVPLVAVITVIAILACLAGPRADIDVVTVALGWLVLPPAILLAVSHAHPVYTPRYVIFCLPALALLEAAGLASLARLTGRIAVPWVRGVAAWGPSAVVVLILALLLVAPQHRVRSSSSRSDNLRAASAIVAAHEQPGDAVLYVPATRRVFGMGYPQPFLRLRDIALARPPVTADNLLGITVRVSTLRHRFAGVRRVWLVGRATHSTFPRAYTRLQAAEISLLRTLHVVGRWRAGDVGLTLFVRR